MIKFQHNLKKCLLLDQTGLNIDRREHKAVNYTGTQSFIHLIPWALKLWTLLLNYFNLLVQHYECSNFSNNNLRGII